VLLTGYQKILSTSTIWQVVFLSIWQVKVVGFFFVCLFFFLVQSSFSGDIPEEKELLFVPHTFLLIKTRSGENKNETSDPFHLRMVWVHGGDGWPVEWSMQILTWGWGDYCHGAGPPEPVETLSDRSHTL
jgi:hypothetical protein